MVSLILFFSVIKIHNVLFLWDAITNRLSGLVEGIRFFKSFLSL